MGNKPRAVTDESEKAAYDKKWEKPELPKAEDRPVASYIEVQKHLNEGGVEIAKEGEMEMLKIRTFVEVPAEVGLELGVAVGLVVNVDVGEAE